jgi:hypothetical protein
LRTPAINTSLLRTLTAKRLDKYLAVTNQDLDQALKLYEENTKLAEAFYTPLQCVEVCLRNCIQNHLATRYGVDWFQNGGPPFSAISKSMIGEAFSVLADASKAQPYDANDVVAELKFAFWVGLFGPHYDNTLWRLCVHRAFSNARLPRRIIHGRFNAIRRFRNRVMHHEPIYHRPLQQLHDEIIEAVGWMCRDTAAWCDHHSRFQNVLVGHRG